MYVGHPLNFQAEKLGLHPFRNSARLFGQKVYQFIMSIRTRRKMAIYDRWDADNGYSIQGEELDVDVADWPDIESSADLTLRLEELTHYDISERIAARDRNLNRLWKAKDRKDIKHLEVHYTCCVDNIQRRALEELIRCDGRKWFSVTLQGINGFGDLYAKPSSLENMSSLFLSLKNVDILNLHSCTLNRGHGLDEILKTIPFLNSLQELRLIGWQMDGVSISTLIESLKMQESKSITLLSLRSCCFLGEGTFRNLIGGLSSISQLKTLNLSYCNLVDHDIVYLVQSLKNHQSLECLHIGGNQCFTSGSVAVLSDWIQRESCILRDLNLRGLWLGFSEEGLLQRVVDLSQLLHVFSKNHSLKKLTLSENYLEDKEIKILTRSLKEKNDLKFLDVADNPFGEKGAQSLLNLVQNCSLLESIRFENHFMVYRCAEAIRTCTRFNFVDNRLAQPNQNIPLSVWPVIFNKIQRSCGDRYCTDSEVSDILFRLLQSPSGGLGMPLYFLIATKTW